MIENLRGESETIRISDIRPLHPSVAKEHFSKATTSKQSFPVFVADLLMIIDRKGKIHNADLFRAILNGYKIDLVNTQVPNSEKDDDLLSK